MKVSTVTMELSELRTSVCGETDTSDIPVYNECFIPDRRRPVKVSPDANTQVVISDNQWNSRDCCFSVCFGLSLLVSVGLSCFMFGGHCHQRPITQD